MPPSGHLFQGHARRTSAQRRQQSAVQGALLTIGLVAVVGILYISSPLHRSEAHSLTATSNGRVKVGGRRGATHFPARDTDSAAVSAGADVQTQPLSSKQSELERELEKQAADTRQAVADGQRMAAEISENSEVKRLAGEVQQLRQQLQERAADIRDVRGLREVTEDGKAGSASHGADTDTDTGLRSMDVATSGSRHNVDIAGQAARIAIHPRVALLSPGGNMSPPDFTAQELLDALKPRMKDVTVHEHGGEAAIELGSFLGTFQLPALVFLPPHCIPASCGAPPVLPLVTAAVANRLQKATSAQDAAHWILNQRKPAVMLANDHPTATIRFWRIGATNGDDQWDIKPLTRFWVLVDYGIELLAAPLTEPRYEGSPWAWAKILQDEHIIVRAPGDCNFIDEQCRLPVHPEIWSQETVEIRNRMNADLPKDIGRQKEVIHRFTPVGFEKTVAPPALFGLLRDYWERHNGTAVEEHWDPWSTFVNHEASRFMMVDLPDNVGSFKTTMYEMLRPIFEQWAGLQPNELQPSAIYGIRIYTKGSTLMDHVDKPQTHIISAIINVAQELEEPWPLEIFGHSNKSTHVTLEPGEMLLYEGASCAHGRPKPLKGRFMGNVFVHMAPRNPYPPHNTDEIAAPRVKTSLDDTVRQEVFARQQGTRE
mmetsp:Transcript_16609/g.49689  ORF Transcript_16609/g.49689 Transcript_16609/m.49689 type:complete len:656 (+) Transcript_16609:522-2489(+)|eukprot:CAMPEP_0206141930 /NCGR_PEP_ID=MMETSP1473-20131121/14770_1 /ASSEMBLY_ACC=CAM_ASM_001109 /TAXON_ID=1461547 /ORGANISM="Stichococcus sp, Strain RCC1054" /LENGTH=655 /DNA_ID=CAMNT_0053536693 /DNA_START=502 /DNA_END=2469 /DNA_ORIENTATION=+